MFSQQVIQVWTAVPASVLEAGSMETFAYNLNRNGRGMVLVILIIGRAGSDMMS